MTFKKTFKCIIIITAIIIKILVLYNNNVIHKKAIIQNVNTTM